MHSSLPRLPAAIPLCVPTIAPAGVSAIISHWYVETGDSILAGDQLLELLVPGMTYDLAAPVSGCLIQILRDVDASVAAGEIVGWILPANDS